MIARARPTRFFWPSEIAAYGTPAALRASPNEHVQRFIHAGSVEAH